MHIIMAQFDIKPQHRDAFIDGMLENARTTRQIDPASVRFDVIQDLEHPNRIFLYEVCRDKEGFEAHLQAPHFLRFQANWEEWLLQPVIIHCAGNNIFPADGAPAWGPGR